MKHYQSILLCFICNLSIARGASHSVHSVSTLHHSIGTHRTVTIGAQRNNPHGMHSNTASGMPAISGLPYKHIKKTF